MKKVLSLLAGALVLVSCGIQLNSERILSGGLLATQAITLSDAQVREYVSQYIAQLDAQSVVLPASNAYSKRLAGLTAGLTEVDGVPLNFKVYQTREVNAFACADGSVRVYTGIMDLMTDDELLGVIGHEIGHVAMKHSRKAMQNALLTDAAFEGVASTGSVAATLTDSQLGALGKTIVNAQYSKKQETEADDFGYDFLKGAGKNPWAIAKAFEKLQAASGESGMQGSSLANLFSSHPDTATRIKRVSERATKDGFVRP